MVSLYLKQDYGWDGEYDFENTGIGSFWTCIDPNACYTVNMNDDYGDGWNGNILTINSETIRRSRIHFICWIQMERRFRCCPFECDADIVECFSWRW